MPLPKLSGHSPNRNLFYSLGTSFLTLHMWEKIESLGETWRDLPNLYSHWGCSAGLRRCVVAFEMRLLCSLVFVFLRSCLQVFDSVRNKGPR